MWTTGFNCQFLMSSGRCPLPPEKMQCTLKKWKFIRQRETFFFWSILPLHDEDILSSTFVRSSHEFISFIVSEYICISFFLGGGVVFVS